MKKRPISHGILSALLTITFVILVTPVFTAAAGSESCPACGYENAPGTKFCTKCGSDLVKTNPPGAKYCTQCGAEIPEDAKFCTKCGYSLKPKKAEVGAALAPPPTKGVYFTGGLASHGGIELITKNLYFGQSRGEIDMGRSWAAGGGFILPLWTRPGVVQLSLELSSDAGFNKIYKEFEFEFGPSYHRDLGYENSFIPIRETAIFGVGVGPGKMVKPFCGIGGGVGIVMWEFRDVDYVVTLDEGTSIKPVFDIPFGCEFQLTPRFALGVKADYLIILGDIETSRWENTWLELDANASVPDVFLFGGVARLGF